MRKDVRRDAGAKDQGAEEGDAPAEGEVQQGKGGFLQQGKRVAVRWRRRGGGNWRSIR